MSDQFEDEVLSPDKEAPSEGDLLRVKSNEAMDSILLETTPVDEKAVDMSEPSAAAAAAAVSADTSKPQLAQEEPPAEGITKLTIADKAADISTYFMAEEQNDPFAELSSQPKEEELAPSEPVEVPVDPGQDDNSSDPPTAGDEDDEDENSVYATPMASMPLDKMERRPSEPRKTQTVRIRCTSESNREEAVPVPFEEAKGEGLKVTQSTKNLTKFFVESPTESDPEAKEFFDTFAAADNDSAPTMTISAPDTSQPPETPPIPGSVQTTPFTSLTSQISQEEKPDSFSSIEASFQDAEDAFSTSLQMSEAERRHDAWIPSEMTRQTLAALASDPATFIPEPSHLSMPGLMFADPLGDPVKDLMIKFMGEAAASKRQTLDMDAVPQDKHGLTALIKAECFRAAVDLTGRLLAACGQGMGKVHTPTKHTPYSLELWYVRFGLMMKLRLYSQAEAEMQAFGNLDNPDMYYEFYPESYPGRRGSMVSFDMRMLHAELPQYLGKTQESLDRLDYLHAIVKKMKSNLESGFAEDGTLVQCSDASRQASRDLWHSREVRLLYSISNCLLNIKDFGTALNIFHALLKYDKEHETDILSATGRIYLQMGDIGKARQYFDRAEKNEKKKISPFMAALNKGFQAMGNNQFSDAFSAFKKAVEIEPSSAIAINNLAVCALYQGKLKEALQILESLVQSDPSKYLQEGVLFNLCTLYELESSRAMNKKQNLLDLVSQHKGNGFNVACLKMA